LFRSRQSFGLGLTAVADHYQAMQLVKCQLLQQSDDDSIRALYTSMKSRQTKGRKWRASRTMNDVDTEVDLKIHFPAQTGKSGLGHGNFNRNPSKSERRKLAARVIKDFADEKRIAHAPSLARLAVWLQWSDTTIPFDFSWKNLFVWPWRKGPEVCSKCFG
jgi:hypothetical protein